MTVLGDYDGVESTVYIKGKVGNCEVRPKTDHYCVMSCGDNCFGGYPVNVNFDDNTIKFKKEWTHEIGYSPRLAEKKVTFPKDKWFGLRGKVYNIGNNVKIEGWLDLEGNGNFVKMTELIDDGNIECGNDTHPPKKYPPYTARTKGSAIRVNNPTNTTNGIQFKQWTIKQI